MKILFLDQSGQLGGAELCLLDIAKPYGDRGLVALFTDGPFRSLLQQHQIPTRILATRALRVNKQSGWFQGFRSLAQLLPMIVEVARIAQDYDLIYANTQKALVVGALASWLGRCPLIYHLHDILSADHFSASNRQLAVMLANQFASIVIANSEATRQAFLAAGGQAEKTTVIYNGFDPHVYRSDGFNSAEIRQQLGLTDRFVVGHFSRLSPWKGQHVLLEALANCPADVTALFVGDALFGEQAYVQALQAQVETLGLRDRVQFLGFRSDVIPLMQTCDVVIHSSTAPEPFGRVIVEAMLCGKPVIAAQAGGAVELVEPEVTGWLVPPANPQALAAAIAHCRDDPETTAAIARAAQATASQRFHLNTIQQQLAHLLHRFDPASTQQQALINHHSSLGG